MIKAILFDMNETMLNMEKLSEKFSEYFSDKYVVRYWFAKMLHSSVVIGGLHDYANFAQLAKASLENVFYENNRELTDAISCEILSAFKSLPAYADVVPTLNYLKEKGIKTYAVSNSSLEMTEEQLKNAGILELFDEYYSVDAVNKYKPFHEIYHYVSTQEQFSPNEMAMIACHDWDIYGAKKAGLITGYIPRKKEIYHPNYAQPDFINDNMLQLVKLLL